MGLAQRLPPDARALSTISTKKRVVALMEGGGNLVKARCIIGLILAATLMGCATGTPVTLQIGAPAPGFSLAGVDGKVHALSDYASSPVLVVVFTCNHCPAAQLYEQRIKRLSADYRARGVAVVAINPDSEKTIAVSDLSYSDVPDTLEGMKVRAAYRQFDYPYLYDGDSQTAARAFRVVALPQVFVFDAQRTLRYVGRIDDHVQADRVTSSDARLAIDAVLAQRDVRTATTIVQGCPMTWLGETAAVQQQAAELAAAPVRLELIGAPDLAALRRNGTRNLMMVNFWATWCAPCIIEFPELQTTYRMYRSRNLEFVTVSTDSPDAKASVVKLLQEQRASSRNHLFGSDDTAALQDAFDRAMPAAVPFTLLLAPGGDVVHQQLGEADFPSLRRAILANLPDDPRYPGLRAYWAE
ncbi:MAG: redoxin domain-containing protein [Vicinamibacterales bacterium]